MRNRLIHRVRTRGSRGFTLTELLVTMGVIAILAAVAVFSIGSDTERAAMNDFAGEIKLAMKEARSRATSSGVKHVVELEATRVRWCQQDCSSSSPKVSAWRYAKNGAQAVYYADSGDIGVGPRPPTTAMGTGTRVLTFYPDGTMDSNTATTTLEGFTVYLQHSTNTSLQYRIAVMPFAGVIRKYVSWD